MAKKWCLIIDITRCDGCGSCLLSVKDEYTYGNSYPGYSAGQPVNGANWLWLKEVEQGQGDKIKMDYIPVMFPHDRNQKPIPGVPEDAFYVREDGISIIDPEKAKGCKALYDAFKDQGTIFWNEELDIPQIYTLDAHRLDEGDIPRCCDDCPTQAMHWGDLNDPDSDVSRFIAEHPGEELEDLFPKEGADYVVKYYKLPKPFIAGEIMLADSEDCVEGAAVSLTCEDGTIDLTTTDFFGDFQFLYLKKGLKYTLKAEVPGYKAYEAEILVDEAKNLGVITLEK